MFEELKDQANILVASKMEDELNEMSQYQRDLCPVGDRRALRKAWYNTDMLVIPGDYRRDLDYYGGFEYVDAEYVMVVGDFVIYSGDHERVRNVLDTLTDLPEEEEHEEEAG